jgi:hypothetical protein
MFRSSELTCGNTRKFFHRIRLRFVVFVHLERSPLFADCANDLFGSVTILLLSRYYKKYSNRRADYIDAWWTIVNWRAISESFKLTVAKP